MPNGLEPHPPPSNDPYQLDRRLTILETRVDTMLPMLATKADLAQLRAELTKWLVVLSATMFVGFGGMIAAMF